MINGQITDLSPVQGTMQLTPAAAAAWQAMVDAAARDKVGLHITAGGAYRDLKAQRALAATGAKVGAVGAQSHGWGDRVDVGSFPPAAAINRYGAAGRARRAWLLANADRFGFTREFGEADPNHFKYTATSTPSRTGTNDMLIRFGNASSITDFAYSGTALRLVTDPAVFNAIGVPGITVIPDSVSNALGGGGVGRRLILTQLFGISATDALKFSTNPAYVWVDPYAGGGTGWVPADADVVDEAEMAALETRQTGDIFTHIDNKATEIINEIHNITLSAS